MKGYQQRVVDERNELLGKCAKLAEFRDTQVFRDLPTTDRALLVAQHSVMCAYGDILLARIELF